MTETQSPPVGATGPASAENHSSRAWPSFQRLEAAVAPDTRLWRVLTALAVVLGCALRLFRWLDNPSLWLDESYLAINLVDKSFSDIFGTLHFNQSAPPGFLGIEKIAELTLGDAEWSLRLFPLLASVVSVVLFAYVAVRVLSPPAAALAVGLFATVEPVLLRAAEVKHYSTDVAMTTVVVALYLWATDAPPGRGRARLIVLAVAGAMALWFSFPAAFVFAAIVVALAIRAWETRSSEPLVGTAFAAVLSLASFAAVYAVAITNVSRVSSSIFGGSDEGLSAGRLKTVENAWWMFINPGGFENETNSLAALLALFGFVALARRGSLDRLALFGIPFVLAGLADLLDKYPLGGRFSMFLVPLLVLLVARGGQALVAWSRQPLVVGAGVGAFLLASPLAIGVYHALESPARSDVRPVLREIARGWRAGDSLYVYADSQYQLGYHARCEDCSPSRSELPWPTRPAPPGPPGDQDAPALLSVSPSVVIGSKRAPGGPLSDLERLGDARRVWLLFSTSPGNQDGLDDEQLLRNELETGAKLVKEIRSRGARAYLYVREASG